MYRRCHFLEECPYLKFNEGVGVLKMNARGKPTGEYTNTCKLRSVLLETMMDEVSDFCKHSVKTHQYGSPYNQV